MEDKKERLHDVETVTDFSYQGNRINSGGGCEVALTSRTRFEKVIFRECQDLHYGKKFPLEIKGIIYKSSVRSAMLYGNETWP